MERRKKRIISNSTTWPFQRYPWIAQIILNFNHICGATIISPNYLLTAAHCGEMLRENEKLHGVGEINPFHGFIALGSQSKNTEYVMYKIVEFFMHPSYEHADSRPINDIALVKVKNPIAFSSRISPICLPSLKILESPGQMALAIGWGSDQISPSTVLLKEVDLPIVENSECRNTTTDQFADRIVPEIICAGGQKSKDTCSADSGGPLQVQDRNGNWHLVGITSWGNEIECGTEGNPAFYVRVSSYLDWILNYTRDSDSCKASDFIRMEPNLQECGLPAKSVILSRVDDEEETDEWNIDEETYGKLDVELEFPWMVRIIRGNTLLGTGVLVNSSTVLTSTSVVSPWGVLNETITVHFGNGTREGSHLKFQNPVQSILFHPLGNNRHNYVLLRLKTALADATEPFHPICFSNGNFIHIPGDEVISVVPADDRDPNTTFVALDGRIVKTDKCYEEMFMYPKDKVLCARIYDSVPNCKVRGGYPLMHRTGQRMYFIGFGENLWTQEDGCLKLTYDVNYALPWIKSTIILLNMV